MIVPPFLSTPSFSAQSIIEMPMRSLTEYPGLRFSILAKTCALILCSLVMLLIRTSGVLPIRPRMSLCDLICKSFRYDYIMSLCGKRF